MYKRTGNLLVDVSVPVIVVVVLLWTDPHPETVQDNRSPYLVPEDIILSVTYHAGNITKIQEKLTLLGPITNHQRYLSSVCDKRISSLKQASWVLTNRTNQLAVNVTDSGNTLRSFKHRVWWTGYKLDQKHQLKYKQLSRALLLIKEDATVQARGCEQALEEYNTKIGTLTIQIIRIRRDNKYLKNSLRIAQNKRIPIQSTSPNEDSLPKYYERIIMLLAVITLIQLTATGMLWIQTRKGSTSHDEEQGGKQKYPFSNNGELHKDRISSQSYDVGVVTFNQETKEKARDILTELEVCRNSLEDIYVQSELDCDKLPCCKYYIIWVDCGSRNTILERKELGEGSLRCDTVQQAKRLGGETVLVYFGHKESKKITTLYDKRLDSNGHPVVKQLCDKKTFFSVYRTLNVSQKERLKEILRDDT